MAINLTAGDGINLSATSGSLEISTNGGNIDLSANETIINLIERLSKLESILSDLDNKNDLAAYIRNITYDYGINGDDDGLIDQGDLDPTKAADAAKVSSNARIYIKH